MNISNFSVAFIDRLTKLTKRVTIINKYKLGACRMLNMKKSQWDHLASRLRKKQKNIVVRCEPLSPLASLNYTSFSWRKIVSVPQEVITVDDDDVILS